MTSVMTSIHGELAESVEASLSKTPPWSPSSPSNRRIGSQLRLVRESHGISEKELSEQLGIDCEDLRLYEFGWAATSC